MNLNKYNATRKVIQIKYNATRLRIGNTFANELYTSGSVGGAGETQATRQSSESGSESHTSMQAW